MTLANPVGVMAGLDPAIHEKRHVNARIKSGHDGLVGCGQG
jgi:hypothetical protein